MQQTYADKLATPIRDKQTGDKRPRELSDLTEIGTIRSHYSGNTGLGINDIPGVRGTACALFNAIPPAPPTTVPRRTHRARPRPLEPLGRHVSEAHRPSSGGLPGPGVSLHLRAALDLPRSLIIR